MSKGNVNVVFPISYDDWTDEDNEYNTISTSQTWSWSITCPHCGQYVWYGNGYKYCPYCGKELFPVGDKKEKIVRLLEQILEELKEE